MTATDKVTSTDHALLHIRHVHQALNASRNDGFNGQGVFLNPDFQAATLRQAREELDKAIKIIERTQCSNVNLQAKTGEASDA